MTILARARVVLEGDTVALTKSLKGATVAMNQAGRKMNAIGKSMSLKVTLPILAVGAASVKAFGSFDNAMTQSIAIMGDVSDAMRHEMEEAAKDVARATTIGASTAAEAYFFLASAGLDAAQSVAALPQVARFAQAGMFNMATATDLATDAQSALGLTVDDAQQNLVNLTRITDVLVKANTLANASVIQFSEALTREAGAAMKVFNIDIEEGVAVLAAFADQGVKSQLAGTGLARILRLLSNAATKHSDALQGLEIAVFDSEGAIRNFADILLDMETAFGRMSDEERTAALETIGFTARVQGILLPLLGTSAAIKEYEIGLRNAGGTTRDVSDKQLKSFTAQLKLTWNQVVLAAEALGKTLAPAVLKVGGVVRGLALAFEEMNESTRTATVVIGGLVATIGPMLLLVGGLTLVIAKVNAGIVLLLPKLVLLTSAVWLMRLALGGVLLTALGAFITMMVRTKTAVQGVARAMKDANEKADQLLTTLSPEAAGRAVDAMQAHIDQNQDLLDKLNQNIQDLLEEPAAGFARGFSKRRREIDAEIVLIDERIVGIEETNKRWREQLVILKAVAALGAPEGVELTPAQVAAAEMLERVKESVDALKASWEAATTLNELFGESFNLVEEQAAALEAGIGDLVTAGAGFDEVVGPNGETLRELAELYLELQQQMQDAEVAQAALTQVEEDAKATIQSILTPLEMYDARLLELKEHLDNNRLSQEQYNRAVAQATEELGEAAQQGIAWGQIMERTIENTFQTFIDWTKGADDAFKAFADSVIRELQRISAKFLASKIFNALSSAGVEGKAEGGFVGGGRIALVGEAGPELIKAGRSGLTVAPMNDMEFSAAGAGGSGPAPQIHVTINAVDARSFAELAEANPGAIMGPLLQALHRSAILQGALNR